MIPARTRKIAVAGTLSAVVLTLQITGLGLIPLPLASLTIMHVPVIIGAILEGPLTGAFIGLLFGVFSLIRAATAPFTPFDAAFVNPLVSVLPRLCIGPAAALIYRLVRGPLTRGEKAPDAPLELPRKGGVPRECAAIVAGAIAGSLVNTTLVLSALAFSGILPVPEGKSARQIILTIAGTNGLFEALFAAVISLSVITAWKHIPRRRRPKLMTR